MNKFKLTAKHLENTLLGARVMSKVVTGDDFLHLQELAKTLEADGYRGIVIEPNLMPYEPNTLPHPDWSWEGVMAGPDGFSGAAYVANVAKDPQGQLWVFTCAGRFRVHRKEFERKMISSLHLAGLPLQLEPSDRPLLGN